jgi:hypothetical protein
METVTLFRNYFGILATLVVLGCQEKPKPTLALHENPNPEKEVKIGKRELSPDFKAYWYNGEAEVSSYTLEQARYGELRQGHAVLIYVTEPFLKKEQVKADRAKPEDVNVLKLNYTKKFHTGLYPYSIMTSTFMPTKQQGHALKVSSSMQEWCGHVYTQLNNRDLFKIRSHSYFEGEADKSYALEKTWLEDELWTLIRIAPEELPAGEIQLIPGMEAARLKHFELKAYTAQLSLTESTGGTLTYTIQYPDLNRNLSIQFEKAAPHKILAWEEQFRSGFGSKARVLTTKATLKETLLTPYWTKNKNADGQLRQELLLD